MFKKIFVLVANKFTKTILIFEARLKKAKKKCMITSRILTFCLFGFKKNSQLLNEDLDCSFVDSHFFAIEITSAHRFLHALKRETWGERELIQCLPPQIRIESCTKK